MELWREQFSWREKKLLKRKIEYLEQIQNSTKASISIMIYGSGIWIIAPPYVAYNTEGAYYIWTEGGPFETRLSWAISGWFNARMFKDIQGLIWKILAPNFEKQSDVKVLIGNNLRSHFNYQVVSRSELSNAIFAALLFNATQHIFIESNLKGRVIWMEKENWESIIENLSKNCWNNFFVISLILELEFHFFHKFHLSYLQKLLTL